MISDIYSTAEDDPTDLFPAFSTSTPHFINSHGKVFLQFFQVGHTTGQT